VRTARHAYASLRVLPPLLRAHPFCPQYLGDLDAIKADVAKVAAQASAKKA